MRPRFLLRRPAWSVIATLAVSVAVLTATFNVIYAALLRPPPFRDAERLTMLYTTHRERATPQYEARWSFPRLQLLRRSANSFTEIAAYTGAELNLTGSEETELVHGEFVSAEYFTVLGLRATHGRTFAPSESDPHNRVPVAIIGHDIWTRRFGGARDVVGATIRINGTAMTIVGIMPPRFRGLTDRAQLWLPVSMAPLLTYPEYLTTNQDFISAVARLTPNASVASASAELSQVAPRLYAAFPGSNADSTDRPGALARSLNDARVLPQVRSSLTILFGAVALLHLLALANAISLLLGRSLQRGREYAVRTALGAHARQLRANAFADGSHHAVIGGIVGVALGIMLSKVVPAPLDVWGRRNFYGSLAAFATPEVNWATIAFGACLTIVTALVAGMAPALSAARTDWIGALRDGPRGSSAGGHSLRRTSARALLSAGEVALAMSLCVVGGLMFDSFLRMRTTPIGVNADGVLTFTIHPPEARVSPAQAPQYIDRMLAAITAVPGVRSATVDGGAPVSGTARSTLMIVGRELPPEGRAPAILRHYVGPDHFSTMGIPIVKGRAFTARDVASAPGVTIISETAARNFWPNADPIGQRVWFGGGSAFNSPDSSAEVIGVVRDVEYEALDSRPNRSSFYTPYAQFSYGWRVYFVRAEDGVPPLSLVAPIRRAVHGVDPEVPVAEIRDLRSLIGASWSRQRNDAAFYTSFALLALGIAVAGVYAVVAHSVAQRTREMGIRMALGATRKGIVALVLREGLVFPAVGMIAGVGLSLALGGVLRASMHGISPTDPIVIASAVVVLAVAAMLACLVPACHATNVNPSEALRTD